MSETKTILVTGGAGFIGSHTCVELLTQGHSVVVVDDLSNADASVIGRIRQIVADAEEAGEAPCGASYNLAFYQVDINDSAALNAVFDARAIDAVIHFAGFKAVGESVRKPLEYYRNNVGGTMALVECMRSHGCKNLVFSSSATVYAGNPIPYVETMPAGAPASPYGWTKWMIERILTDLCAADSEWNVVLLRYFNPVGAHPSGLIGEDPQGVPNNLMPFVAQVATGQREELHVFGDDYDTPDGTCQRDFIHVVDLAKGHVAALEWMEGRTGCEAFNLGAGQGISVLELVHAYERACGHEIPYVVDPRRDGDLPFFWADPSKANEQLNWRTELDLDTMCQDSWRYQTSQSQA